MTSPSDITTGLQKAVVTDLDIADEAFNDCVLVTISLVDAKLAALLESDSPFKGSKNKDECKPTQPDLRLFDFKSKSTKKHVYSKKSKPKGTGLTRVLSIGALTCGTVLTYADEPLLLALLPIGISPFKIKAIGYACQSLLAGTQIGIDYQNHIGIADKEPVKFVDKTSRNIVVICDNATAAAKHIASQAVLEFLESHFKILNGIKIGGTLVNYVVRICF
ncbi:MAG: hypothetical protein H0W88_03970 [Parachlamydiaceae bacterium]|nr:hypothetical protein [Parachlamydiaceae bacterium]